jgi:hypothetical protein
VCTHLKLLTRLLIGVRRPLHCDLFNSSGKWNWTHHLGSAAPNSLNNFRDRLIQHSVVKAPQSDSDPLIDFHVINS